jgi:hypothetical protein
VTGAALKVSARAPRTAARAEPDKTPIFATAAYTLPENACSANSNDKGSPMLPEAALASGRLRPEGHQPSAIAAEEVAIRYYGDPLGMSLAATNVVAPRVDRP